MDNSLDMPDPSIILLSPTPSHHKKGQQLTYLSKIVYSSKGVYLNLQSSKRLRYDFVVCFSNRFDVANHFIHIYNYKFM